MMTNQDDQDKESDRQGCLHGYVRVSTREQAGDDIKKPVSREILFLLTS
jgi:hypothetical protein